MSYEIVSHSNSRTTLFISQHAWFWLYLSHAKISHVLWGNQLGIHRFKEAPEAVVERYCHPVA